jgi:superfamily I DNA and/or RNA helicase
VSCNEHRRTLEEAGHTYFDVAIVDEVSKATPPELLLPMMLARKTILVGDHRQLPPLFKERQGSWEEVLDQQEEDREEGEAPAYTELTPENFERYRRMVTASLFKEHFENAHASLKAPLFVQYRMHSDIMDVVNHFYEGKLRSGLDPSDPEQRREHGMTILSPAKLECITPQRHAVWIDSGRDPAGRPHEEEQAGTSSRRCSSSRRSTGSTASAGGLATARTGASRSE